MQCPLDYKTRQNRNKCTYAIIFLCMLNRYVDKEEQWALEERCRLGWVPWEHTRGIL